MIFGLNRAGAFAAAATLVAGSFGAIAAGAYAQDQGEVETPEMAAEAAVDAPVAPGNEVRFVASPVVQDLPEQPEAPVFEPSNAASLRELVTQMGEGETISREMHCLAQAVYFESRGEPLTGQLAVARVVINRASHATFPDDYCSVVTQRAQFSFVRGGRIPEPNKATSAWSRAKAIARIAHRGMWDSEAKDSLYFHATYVRPRWANRMQARATIDRHIFYR